MRKKSHIALAGFLTANLQSKALAQHRKAFCLGSILPDLNPKMVAEPHEFDTSWFKIKELIRRLGREGRSGDYSGRILWRQAGVVIHYLADYFTYPHNTCFPGSLKDHCMHESQLKYALRAYLHTREAARVFEAQRASAAELRCEEDLIAYIEEMHARYMQAEHSVSGDCLWIVEVCSKAAAALAVLTCAGAEESFWRQHRAA